MGGIFWHILVPTLALSPFSAAPSPVEIRAERCLVNFCERRQRTHSLSLGSQIQCGMRCLRGLSVRPGDP